MMHKRAHKSGTAGQIYPQAKYLSDIINRMKKYDALMNPKTGLTETEDAYLKGYQDGLKEGFKQGIQWVKG